MVPSDKSEIDRHPRASGLRQLLRWIRGNSSTPAEVVGQPAQPPEAPSEFERVRANWEALGQHDPLWAIVSTPDKRGNRWDRDEFFATGVVEVRHVMNMLREVGLAVARGRALDFGAGVGRLTQALAEHFEQVDGVDISAPMLVQAKALNRHGDRVRYGLGESDRLLFPDACFDFLLSRIVLQHVGIDLQRRYVREFVRVLKPDGIAVFQAPSRAIADDGVQFRTPVDTPDGTVTIDMNIFPRADVERTVADAGGRILHARADFSAGDAFESVVYVVAHQGAQFVR